MSGSWDAVRDWDVLPQEPIAPAGISGQAVHVDPAASTCSACRGGRGGLRADDLGQHQAKMQEELLGSTTTALPSVR